MAQHQISGGLLIGVIRDCRQLGKGRIVAAVGVDAVVVQEPLAVDALSFGKETVASVATDDGGRIFEDALKTIDGGRLYPANQARRQILKDLGAGGGFIDGIGILC